METPIDLIAFNHGGTIDPRIDCLDSGFVRLVDVMPRVSYDQSVTTCDHAVVQAARVSYGNGTKQVSEDAGLIRYLMRHRHTTPSEMIEFKFHCMMPILVARQWIRHRTANVNESSGRYSVMPDNFYQPTKENVRKQSKTNKQVSEGQVSEGDAEWFLEQSNDTCSKAYKLYEEAIERGIGKEQARMVLPVNIYTEWYWKIDAHNLLHFLALRCDAHAQMEIRVFADAMLKLVTPLIPVTIAAWEDYHPMRGGVLLTRLEAEAISTQQSQTMTDAGVSCPKIKSDNKREIDEWHAKAKKLGFQI